MHLFVDGNPVVLDRFIVGRLRHRDHDFDALCLLHDLGKVPDAEVLARYEHAAACMVEDDLARETMRVGDEASGCPRQVLSGCRLRNMSSAYARDFP